VEYFVPNSKINIIVNLNQSRVYLEQNLNVMDYTSKAKNIKSNCNSDFAIMMKNSQASQAKLKLMREAISTAKKEQFKC